jgi:single-stranded-DNA-specific exonuclease
MKRWKLVEPAPEEAYQALPDQPRLLAALLWRRGVRTSEEAGRFLSPDWERDVHDPFLFADMRKAVDRIMRARDGGEKIVVHGDYDADGVSGSVILHSTLKELGADASVYLPHREKEGYGIAPATIEKLAAEGTKVIITCDCGISNGAEIALAVERGIDVIITDHHTLPPALPPAYAILHPLRQGETYPFRHLTGGGVAFKLCQALWREAKLAEGRDKWLLDMVSISTVADMGALVGENRALVHYGLKVLAKTRRVGLAAMMDSARMGDRPIDAGTIGFQIAPRINAAGRMDHASGAFSLLSAETKDDAAIHVERLNQHNLDRRAQTERLVTVARQMAAEQKDAKAIVVAGEGWPAALCGLIAARLVDDSYKPVIALGRDENGRYVGSGRSIPEYDVTAALRRMPEGLLKKFGGHPAACGLTIEGGANYEAFARVFAEDASAALEGVELIPTLKIEEKLALDEAVIGTLDMLARLEPHGEGNAKPLFLIEDARAAGVNLVGKDGKHLRLVAADDAGAKLKLIAFGFGDKAAELVGRRFDAVVELSVNEWNGYREPQGRVVDLKIHHA